MIKTIVEVIQIGIGLFGVALIGVLIEDILKDNPAYRKAHREKVYEWVLGLRKEFPRFCLALSFLIFSSTVCFAELDPNNPSTKYPVGGGRILTQEEVAYNEAHGIYAVNDKRAKPQTADEIAEGKFAQENMGRDAQGNCVVIPPKTGQRQVISSRLALTPDGQLEGIPTNSELAEHRQAIAKVRAQNEKNAREAGLHFEDLPEEKEKIEKKILDLSEESLKASDDKVKEWDKDKKGETAKYEAPKVFVSYETQKP
jgi:hypothetical protein